MYLPVLAAVRRQDSQFYGIQRIPGIPSREIRQEFKGVLIDHGAIAAHSLLRIVDRTAKHRLDILFIQWVEFKYTGTWDQRSVYLEIRIFRCRSDQGDRPVFHKRKQIILLPFIKPVDLIHKKNRLLLIHAQGFFRLLYHRLHILLSRHRGVDLREFRAGGVGDHLRKSRLPGPRRAVEDDRTQLVRLDRPVQQLIFSYDMLLSHHLLQRCGTHSGSQRRFRLHRTASHIIK